METKMYQINQLFARKTKNPVYFVAVTLRETQRAVYLYGRGTLEVLKTGNCMICGRELTHPVSVQLGIGPECGRHYHNWDLVGGYSLENIEKLKLIIPNIKVDGWFPKGVISRTLETTERLLPPGSPHAFAMGTQPKGEKKLTLTAEGNIKIEFPFSMEEVNKIKLLPGRRYNSEGKFWVCPFEERLVRNLQDSGYMVSAELKSKLNLPVGAISATEGLEKVLRDNRILFGYQKAGVGFIERQNGRALIADEMGLGKTAQVLTWLNYHKNKKPIVVVVPASLKYNWEKEAYLWMDNPNVQILSGTNTDVPLEGDVLIINYDILESWVDTLRAIHPQVLITDECHYYKNNSAKRTKAVKKLAKSIPHVLALSGTPIVNRPAEMFNAIQLINSSIVGNFWNYAHRYCGAKHNGYGWDFNGATNTEELHQKLTASIMIRRLKSEVLHDLPAKLKSFTPIGLDNVKEYTLAEYDFIEFLTQTKGAKAAEKASGAITLVQIEGLKQLAVQGKLTACIEWIRNFLETDDKLVVFAVHKFVIDQLMDEFGDVAVKIDGSVTSYDRQKAVDIFQTDPKVRLFVGNIKAAGVGITLTAASNVVFLELPWTPGELTQAEDRCHRIGQKGNVTIHYLLAKGTIEEKIANLLDSKQKILSKVLDGVDITQESLLSELINSFTSN